jgi:hypothetical protein
VRRLLLVISLVAGICAVGPVAGSAAPAGPFEPVACSEVKTVGPGGQVVAADSIPGLKAARCGHLVVPENRSRPTARSIRLAVAIVPPVSPTSAPDPVVYLQGGPAAARSQAHRD